MAYLPHRRPARRSGRGARWPGGGEMEHLGPKPAPEYLGRVWTALRVIRSKVLLAIFPRVDHLCSFLVHLQKCRSVSLVKELNPYVLSVDLVRHEPNGRAATGNDCTAHARSNGRE